jgi:hypothetical protein
MSQYFINTSGFSDQSRNRIAEIYNELNFALSRIERDAIKNWGVRSAKRLLILAGQRVRSMANLTTMLTRGGSGELQEFVQALKGGRVTEHIGDRTADAIDGSITIGRKGSRLIGNVAIALIRDPRSTAPALIGGLLGFGAGSGGLDGNGGIPDLDLMVDIGAHRSPITHTVIAGILTEGLLLAFADLAAELHAKLPIQHDPVWDGLAEIGRPLTENLAIGASAGLAYHFLVDALVQPAAYHGLPLEMPIEGHQFIFAANGLIEANYSKSRLSGHQSVEIVQEDLPTKSTGRRFVEAVANSSKSVSDGMRNAFNKARR